MSKKDNARVMESIAHELRLWADRLDDAGSWPGLRHLLLSKAEFIDQGLRSGRGFDQHGVTTADASAGALISAAAAVIEDVRGGGRS